MRGKTWRFLAFSIIAMIVLPSVINITFSLTSLQQTENIREFSTDRDSISHLKPLKGSFSSRSKGMAHRRPENNFKGFWNSIFSMETYAYEKEDGGYFSEDYGGSVELVIGVDGDRAEAYASLMDDVSRWNGEIVNTISVEGRVIAVTASIPFNAVSSFMGEIQRNSLARYIEPNMRFQAQFVPNDPYWNLQWGPQIIEADYAWNTTIGNSSILVAVIDTGVDYNHPDLADNYVPLGYDWVNVDNDPMDDNGHGTHCAGIIAAILNNSEGIAGLAQVRIMAEKALDEGGWGYADDLANAIYHAVEQGAKILSNSWGGYDESILIHEAIQYAYQKGVLVIAAAGNDAASTKLYPAAYDEVVAVTATDSSDNPAWFTNFGDWVEVAAPGVYIYSTIWDDSYDYMSGTSMACPHVAGVAALIWSQFPNATRDWVRAQLRYTAEDLGSPGFDEYYGYGRINARRAVEQVPPDHDLLIFDWEKPAYIQPGDVVSFNVTILNFGVGDEQNVTVQLLVDGSLMESVPVSYLPSGVSVTVSFSWNPLVEGTYNITFYVVPVPGEVTTENNVLTKMISVRWAAGFVLFDQTRCDPISYYSTWVADLVKIGYVIDTYDVGTITMDVLGDYDVFVIPQAWSSYSPDEISAIQNFVINGGGLLVIGDYSPSSYTNLTSFAGITWSHELYKWSGPTSDISLHYVTEGVTSVYFGTPYAQLFVSSPAIDIIRDGYGHGEIMLAVSEIGAGRVICIADEDTVNDGHISRQDNLVLAENMIDWLLGVKYEHELVVHLDAPSYLAPNETSLLNATVHNRGLNNETNVELQLLINGTVVTNVIIPELVNGTSFTTSYAWTPSVEAVYNVTAYAPPVPNENVTINNVKTRYVYVQYPLINPVEGQYANYTIYYEDPSGHLFDMGYLNTTYDYYVEPYKIHVSIWYRDPSGYTGKDWMIVNTMNRFVESGVWAGLWYPGWIETDVDVGSTINLLYGTAKINGTRTIIIGARAIDCWEIFYSEYGYQYIFWYDRVSGLWIGMGVTDLYGNRMKLLLTDTNVPIGIQYEHDLGVALDVPRQLQPGETLLLNAIVYNFGLSNETNVKIQLLINGTKVASRMLDKLVNGTWYTLNYSWTPTIEGVYNITAYAPPLLNENVTLNNVVTRMVYVLYVEVALISDYFELMSIAHMLSSIGIGYDIYNNNYMNLYTENLTLLLSYKAVILSKHDRSLTSYEYDSLESYLSLGGNLLITGFDSLAWDPLLADLVRSSSYGNNVGEPDLYVVNGMHPIMNGPYGSFPTGHHVDGLYSDCDLAEADTARNAVTVAELADGYDKIIATEGLPGKVVFWNGMGTYDWTENSDCEAMFKNLLHWFTVHYEHELVVLLQTPSFLEPGDSTTLNATVYNAGLNDEFNVTLQLLINGTIMKNVVIPSLPNRTSYTISYSWTPMLAGIYNITVYAPPVPNEKITTNNVYSNLVPVQYVPRILAYVQYANYHIDYSNTIRIIESTFGPNYVLTELWDYLQLEPMLPGNDILLIPEQEYADLYTMEDIGLTWSKTLDNFLKDGGIIIVCDYGRGFGGTYGILTGAGLMSIFGANYRSYYMLYLADPEDPIAKNVSSSFIAPSGTISFICNETNVVIDDGVYPVVIRKEVGRGHIVLLGFDFYSSNSDTEQLLGNAVSLASYITISITPSAGSPGTEVTVTGAKATSNGTVSIYWDDTFMGNTTADNVGNFAFLLTVPLNATVGFHEITAIDTATGRTASTTFKVFLITLTPIRGPVGTKVTVKGVGFPPKSQITVTFNDMLMGYAAADSFGNLTFTFNVPFSTADVYMIKALDSEGNYAYATFTVIDYTPLNVQVDVGTIHFRGEIAEFYLQTVFKGIAVNATNLYAVLYGPNGETVDYCYPENITLIATGLYKITYTIPVNASTGTYTLVITANYGTDTIQASGTSFKSFLVSPTLTYMDANVVEISEDIATVIIPDLGMIRLNLTAINATLENIFLKVISINGTAVTIQTTLGKMNGTITSMEGNIATIVVPGVGQIQTDISYIKETQQAWIIPQYAIIAIVAVAAVSATASAMLLKRRK